MCVLEKYPELELDCKQIEWSPSSNQINISIPLMIETACPLTRLVRSEGELALGLAVDVRNDLARCDFLFIANGTQPLISSEVELIELAADDRLQQRPGFPSPCSAPMTCSPPPILGLCNGLRKGL